MADNDLVPMSKWSNSADPRGYLQDVTTSTLRARQANGTAPATLGVTVPVKQPSTVQDFTSMFREWNSAMRKQKGPMGYDSNTTPHEASYIQRRYEFLSGEEAVRKVAYDDANGKTITEGYKAGGKVTVGIGFNMDRPGAREDMRRVLNFDDATFDKVYKGQRSLSEVEIRKLFDYTAREAEALVSKKLKDVELEEHQRLALVSLAFNSPALIGPKIVDAIRGKDWKSAVNEILNNSNRKGSLGHAKRRYREAVLFNGPGGGPVEMPEYQSYLEQFQTKTA